MNPVLRQPWWSCAHLRSCWRAISGVGSGLGLALLLLVPKTGWAQTLAFPGAQGFGAYATGGRGGTVYHVTSLADDGSAGTFRVAVSQPNRIIVFDVGGYINLGSAVSASSSLTIAGQTAPGGGIGLMGAELSFYGRTNIICRHLRVRQGGSSTSQSGISIGSASGNSAGNMIFDHTSVAFGQWDSVDAVGTANFTIQNCIIADPINQQFGAHVEGSNACYVNNLWVNAHNRQPLAKANTVFVNNVVYDYQAGYTVGDTGGYFSHDIVNNYFIAGPSTSSAGDDFFQFNSKQTVYAAGNLLDSTKNGALGGSATAPGGVTVAVAPWSAVTATIPTVSAANAYRTDVSSAGAFPSDQLDQQIIGQVMSLGTAGRIIGSTGDTGLGNSGYGTIDGGAALGETDGDGIPDVWKNAVGLNLYTNQAMVIGTNGYANIENYLNWLAGPHALVQTNATVIDLWPYTLGFTNGATYTVFNGTNGTVTLTNSHYALFKPTAGFTGLAGFNFAVADGDGTSLTNTMGLLVSVIYIPKNLVWRGDGSANIWDTTNTADWFNGNELTTFNSSDNVTFDDTGSAAPAINLTGTVAPGGLVFNNSANNYTVGGSGLIAGTNTLVKAGTGTLTLNNAGASTYSGGTMVNGGSVVFQTAAAIPASGTVTLNGTGTVTVSPANTLPNVAVTGTNTITGNGNSGTGITALNDAGNLTVYVTTGAKVFDLLGAMSGTGYLNLGSSPMTLRFNGTAGDANAIFNFGTGTAAASLRNAPFGIALGGLTGGYGTALYGPSSYANQGTYTIGGAGVNTEFDGVIANGTDGATAVVKTGGGVLTLGGTNTYSGPTTVSNGTLNVTGAFIQSPVTVVTNAWLTGAGTLGGGLAVQAGGVVSPGAGIGSAGTLILSNNLTLAAPTLDFDLAGSPAGGNDAITMNGGLLTMSGTMNFQFNLLSGAPGDGTYVLIGGATNNSAAGVVLGNNLPAGTRQTFAMQRPASGSGTGYVWLAVSGPVAASLVWRGTNGNSWDLSATTNWQNGSGADLFYNLDTVRFDDTAANGNVSINGVVQPAAVLVTNNATTYTITNGVLAGVTSLVKSGPGTLILNASNSFSGGTFVNGGTLQLVNNGYAAGTGAINLNGGTLYLNGVGTGATIACAGTNVLQTSGQPYATFNLQGSGTLTLSVGSGGTFSPSGNWNGFSGTINFTTGNWIRELNPVTFGSSNAVWNFGASGGLFNKYGGSVNYLGALFGGAGSALSGASTATASLTTYAVGGINTNSVFNGVISDGGAAATALVFNGPGSLALTGNNPFSGGTTVNGGTLLVNNTAGSGTGSGVVAVNNGATLSGTGSIGGVVSLAGGATLTPGGTNGGLLSIGGDLGLNNSSVLQFALGTDSSEVAVAGDLTLGGVLNLTAASGFKPGTYTLFTYMGALGVGTLTLGTVPSGRYGYAVDTSVAGEVNLVVSVPQIGGVHLAANSLVLTGTGGPTNMTYYLLMATNLSTPVAGWTRVQTNAFDAGGNFSLTNGINTNAPRQFYLLEIP